MSYKKWIYKYKYLRAEVDEVMEKMDKYTIEFNKLFISKEKYEKMKNNSNITPIIEEPKLNEINDNTVIFLHDGLNEQTFLISSNNARNQWILVLIIVMLSVILFFGRQLFYRQ